VGGVSEEENRGGGASWFNQQGTLLVNRLSGRSFRGEEQRGRSLMVQSARYSIG